MTLKTIFTTISQQLQAIYEKNEAESIAFLLIEFLYTSTRTDVVAAKEVASFDPAILQTYLASLLTHAPIQYVLGKAHFYGYEFNVNKYTLIPRSETEELVHLIIQENKGKKGLTILDIGTGTGCIPITLCLHLINPTIYALDVDANTLAVAKQNAENLHASITWIETDILNTQPKFDTKVDIIVSNPPYVRELEKAFMQPNVLHYEPAKALFVSNENPLLFYERIATFAKENLCNGGRLYLEINQYLGNDTKKLLEDKGFSAIQVLKDLNNNDRMCACTLVLFDEK